MHELQVRTAHAARTATGRAAAWATQSALGSWLAVGAAAGLFLALIGPLGSYEYGLKIRLAFWIPLCLTAALVALTVEAGLVRAGLGSANRPLGSALFIVAFAAAMTPVVYAANATGNAPPLSDTVTYFRNGLILSTAFLVARQALRRAGPPKSAQTAGQAPTPRLVESSVDSATAFMRRLPSHLRTARLLAVAAEGHYVRVRTSAGSALLLLRLKDAIHELRAVDGQQTHRSWWVARNAVASGLREEGRFVLELTDGSRAPVSRSNATKLKQAGWFA